MEIDAHGSEVQDNACNREERDPEYGEKPPKRLAADGGHEAGVRGQKLHQHRLEVVVKVRGGDVAWCVGGEGVGAELEAAGDDAGEDGEGLESWEAEEEKLGDGGVWAGGWWEFKG